MSIQSASRPTGATRTPATTDQDFSPLRARRAAIGLALVMIPLPLQWYDLGKSSVGTIRFFHVTALLMMIVARPSLPMLRVAMAQVRPLYAASATLVLIGTLTSIGWRSGITQFPQGAFYMLASIGASACLIIALQDERGQKILARTAPISFAVFLLALITSVRGANIDVASQFAQAFAGNPHALQFGVFRAAFRTVEPSVRSSVRHEVFGGLVVVMYIGIVAGLRANYLKRTIGICTVISLALVAFSLSRSVMVGVALTALIGLGRVLVAGRVRVLSFMVGLGVLGALPFIIPKIIPLFSAKITSTSSYDARLGAINEATHVDLERILLGGPLLDHPTQNLVIDVFLRGGLVAGIAALVVELIFLATSAKLIAVYYRTGSIAVLAGVGASMHVLVRSVTGGGNLMDMVEWLGFSLVVAVIYIEARSGELVAGAFTRKPSANTAKKVPLSGYPSTRKLRR